MLFAFEVDSLFRNRKRQPQKGIFCCYFFIFMGKYFPKNICYQKVTKFCCKSPKKQKMPFFGASFNLGGIKKQFPSEQKTPFLK
jgi:hypothetical protein